MATWCRPRTSAPRTGSIELQALRGPVAAEDALERLAQLADRRVRLDRREDRRQEPRATERGFLQRAQRAVDARGIAARTRARQRREHLRTRLVGGLEERGLALLDLEAIHAHEHALARLDRALRVQRREVD